MKPLGSKVLRNVKTFSLHFHSDFTTLVACLQMSLCTRYCNWCNGRRINFELKEETRHCKMFSLVSHDLSGNKKFWLAPLLNHIWANICILCSTVPPLFATPVSMFSERNKPNAKMGWGTPPIKRIERIKRIDSAKCVASVDKTLGKTHWLFNLGLALKTENFAHLSFRTKI